MTFLVIFSYFHWHLNTLKGILFISELIYIVEQSQKFGSTYAGIIFSRFHCLNYDEVVSSEVSTVLLFKVF